MKIKILTSIALFVVAPVVLMGAVESAKADEWFVLGERSLKSADPSAEIKTEGGRWKKNIKKVRFSVEGADVEITQAVLHWDNRLDDTVSVGAMKAGGQTAPKDAPGRKGRLTSVTVQYTILNDAPNATLKVWGFD
jgi:hypothetical protein